MTKNIMVTGGLGYTGRTIVRKLAEQGHRVISYNRDYSELNSDCILPVQGELYDVPRLVRTIRDHGIDRIIHTAAMSHPDLSIELPLTTVVSNIDGTVSLMEAMRMAGIKRLVNFSSETVYGNHDAPIDEASPTVPTTPYGVTKMAVEHFGRVYNDLYGLQALALRFSEVYGPGNKMPQILRDIVKALLRGDRFTMETGADHLFHFIHTEDVADAAILAALSDDAATGSFNVFGDRSWTLAEAAGLIRGLIPDGVIDIGSGFCHLDRQGPWSRAAAKQAFGYEPKVALPEGLAAYVSWLRTNEY